MVDNIYTSNSMYAKDLQKISLRSYSLYLGDYEFLSLLDTGAHSKVLLVKNRVDSRKYVLKLMRVTKAVVSDIEREKWILQSISSKECCFVLKVYGFLQTLGHAGLVMEYLPGVSLKKQLDVVGHFSEGRTVFNSACVASALEYVHSLNIFHRDLSLRNMICDTLGYVKLIDFGLAVLKSNSFCGSEKIVVATKQEKMIDIEDLGRCIWEMLTGESTYTVPSYRKANSKASPAARNLMEMIFPKGETSKLASVDSGIKDVMSQEFFRNFNWDDLKQKKLKPPLALRCQPVLGAVIPIWQEVKNAEGSGNPMLGHDFQTVKAWKAEKSKAI